MDEILALKNVGAETTDVENKTDEMVFDLYGLTAEERKVVRGNA